MDGLPITVSVKALTTSVEVLYGTSDVGVSRVLTLGNNRGLLVINCLETLWQIFVNEQDILAFNND